MRDGIELERLGIPTVSIISETFASLCASQRQALGMTAFELAEVPHPFASLSEEELGQAADRVVAELHRIVLRAEARQSADVPRP